MEQPEENEKALPASGCCPGARPYRKRHRLDSLGREPQNPVSVNLSLGRMCLSHEQAEVVLPRCPEL